MLAALDTKISYTAALFISHSLTVSGAGFLLFKRSQCAPSRRAWSSAVRYESCDGLPLECLPLQAVFAIFER